MGCGWWSGRVGVPGPVLMGLCVYERHRSECNLSRRAAQVLSVCALGGAACITELVLNLTT